MNSKNNEQETIAKLKADNEELIKENVSLKRQIGGYKAAGKRYNEQLSVNAAIIQRLQNENDKKDKEITILQKTVEEKAIYAKEADELNESKSENIFELENKIVELNKKIADMSWEKSSLLSERDAAKSNYEYVCNLPWYKRIFL